MAIAVDDQFVFKPLQLLDIGLLASHSSFQNMVLHFEPIIQLRCVDWCLQIHSQQPVVLQRSLSWEASASAGAVEARRGMPLRIYEVSRDYQDNSKATMCSRLWFE